MAIPHPVAGGTRGAAVLVGSLRSVIGRTFGADGTIRESPCVHAQGAAVRRLQGVDTVLGQCDELLITIPLAGGMRDAIRS